MKAAAYYAVLLALVLGVGCGKKEPELSTEKVITPDVCAHNCVPLCNICANYANGSCCGIC